MAQADLVVLCLHDAAALESVAMVDALPGKKPKIIDSSTAQQRSIGRIDDGISVLPGDVAGD